MQPTLAAAPHPASGNLRLQLLGRFALHSGGCPVQVRPTGERLLAYLAVMPDQVSRPEVAAALWPDCAEARATANLRSALCRLPGRAQGGLVKTSAGAVTLMPGVRVDVSDVSGRLARGPADEEVNVSLLRLDVLPGWPEYWLIPVREWFRQVRLRALETLCDRHRAAGRLDFALDAALAAVGCDPLRESAHRRLALIHMGEGNFAEALRQYHQYKQLAAAELGLPPSSQFRKLISPLLGRPADATA